MKKLPSKFPNYDRLFIPVLDALKALGGSGTNAEINSKVYEQIKLPEEALEILHKEGGNQSEIDYRLAWARTYLRINGLIENSSRGVWALTDADVDTKSLNQKELRDFVLKKGSDSPVVSPENKSDETEESETESWQDELLSLVKKISPAAFERLAQRILRESGFVQVEVTGRTNDGGIDGKGVLRFAGLMSFHVIFQCKRYQGTVGSAEVRNFRGAMTGRAEKGLFLTTGRFSREAEKEANRDGAPPIDLIDGERLCVLLKELDLGVKTELVEKVTVHQDWFRRLE